MIGLGETKGTIVRHYVGVNDNGNPFVAVVIRPRGEEETITAKVYLTTKALRFAAQQLALCGFDINTREVQDLEDHPELLAGTEVPINIYENEFNGKVSTKCDIAVPRPTVDKAKLSDLTKAMRAAVTAGPTKPQPKPKGPAAPAKPRGPAVADVPSSRAAELDAQASEEDIPF